MDVEAVRAHFQQAQGAHARRQSALAIRTRSGVAVNIWRTYGAAQASSVRLVALGQTPGLLDSTAYVYWFGC